MWEGTRETLQKGASAEEATKILSRRGNLAIEDLRTGTRGKKTLRAEGEQERRFIRREPKGVEKKESRKGQRATK